MGKDTYDDKEMDEMQEYSLDNVIEEISNQISNM